MNFQPVFHDKLAIHGDLKDIAPVSVLTADKGFERLLWQTLVHEYHYLGFKTRVGKSIAYLAFDRFERPVAALLFGAAAWKIASRDRFIGWNPSQRKKNLKFIASAGKGVMKMLIFDRGFLDDETITHIKKDHGIDCLFHLKKRMLDLADAWVLAENDPAPWTTWTPPKPPPLVYPPPRPERLRRSEEARQRTIKNKKHEKEMEAPTKPSLVKVELKAIRDMRLWENLGVPLTQVVFILLAYSLFQAFLKKDARGELNQRTRKRIMEELSYENDKIVLYSRNRIAYLKPASLPGTGLEAHGGGQAKNPRKNVRDPEAMPVS